MRLTLRTLLAWLDDTLPPKDVARIGRQLQKSKFAQDLGQRIQRVIRQRRLTVPGMGANTPVDANVISAYLDNSLPPDQLAAVESLCLNSDVHLAEVAACHQILVLLEQPVVVSPRQSSAMYRLVKGNESRLPSDHKIYRQIATSGHLGIADHEFKKELLIRNLKSDKSRSHSLLLLNFLMICAMATFALWLNSISGDPSSLAKTPSLIAPKVIEAEPVIIHETATEIEKIDSKKATELDTENVVKSVDNPKNQASPEPEKTTVAEKRTGQAGPSQESTPTIADFLQLSQKSILLHGTTDTTGDVQKSSWNLVPADFQATSGFFRFADPAPLILSTNSGETSVLSGTLLKWNEKSETQSSLPQLIAGSMKFKSDKPANFGLKISSIVFIRLNLDSGASCVVKSGPVADTSRPATETARSFEIICEKGSCTVDLVKPASPEADVKDLNAGEAIKLRFVKEGGWLFGDILEVNSSGWPTEITSLELTSEQLGRYLQRNRPIASKLMEAMADMQKQVRNQAVKISMWSDRHDLLLQSANEAGSTDSRRSIIDSLRDGLDSGDWEAVHLFESLQNSLQNRELSGPKLKSYISRPGEASNQMKLAELVESLQDMNVIIRDLALDHLKSISGRDNLDYDPDKPSEAGINAWSKWLEMQK